MLAKFTIFFKKAEAQIIFLLQKATLQKKCYSRPCCLAVTKWTYTQNVCCLNLANS